jgi:hypothetical protein
MGSQDVWLTTDCARRSLRPAAEVRMVQAGAKPINWLAVTREWVPDYNAPERAAVGDVWSRRGGGVGLLSDYVLAQVTAGLVPMPSFMYAPDKASSRQAPTDGQTKTAATHSGQRN